MKEYVLDTQSDVNIHGKSLGYYGIYGTRGMGYDSERFMMLLLHEGPGYVSWLQLSIIGYWIMDVGYWLLDIMAILLFRELLDLRRKGGEGNGKKGMDGLDIHFILCILIGNAFCLAGN